MTSCGPDHLPEVSWRGGVDLNPLDVTDEDAMAWLATLVWPEQDERRERLRTAIDVARTDPPRLTRGNLLDALPGLVVEAARHGTVVVFHSAVIAYLDDADRRRFQELMTSLVAEGRCHWVSNEATRVLPDVAATGPDVGEAAHLRARRRRPGGRLDARPRPVDAVVRLAQSYSESSTCWLCRCPTVS